MEYDEYDEYDECVKYDDEFCCDDLECVIYDELCDTHGGDYSSMSVYICTKCNRVFEEYYGCRFEGIKEIYDEDKKEYYMSLLKK